MEEQNIKLTKLTKCAGCGAKVGAGEFQMKRSFYSPL